MLLLAARRRAAAFLPGRAEAAVTATDIRIGNHPAFVRVVVDFEGGRIRQNGVFARRPAPAERKRPA